MSLLSLVFILQFLLRVSYSQTVSSDSYDGVQKIKDLNHGDIVAIKSYKGCYLNAKGNPGDVECVATFTEKSMLWKVYKYAPNNDNVAKFENFDYPTYYLKMEISPTSLRVEQITGRGTATKFEQNNDGSVIGDLFDYKRKLSAIKGILDNKCIDTTGPGDTQVGEATCDGSSSQLFSFERQNPLCT
eukprot:178312_1